MQIFGKLREEIVGFVKRAIENQKNKEEIEKNLNMLTHDLRDKLISTAYLNSLQKVKVLTRHFSSEFIENLVLRIKILQKRPKELIFLVNFWFFKKI